MDDVCGKIVDNPYILRVVRCCYTLVMNLRQYWRRTDDHQFSTETYGWGKLA